MMEPKKLTKNELKEVQKFSTNREMYQLLGRTQINNTATYMTRLRSAGGNKGSRYKNPTTRSNSKKNRIMSGKSIQSKQFTRTINVNATSQNHLPISDMDQFSSDNEHIGNGLNHMGQKSFSIKTRVKSAHK